MDNREQTLLILLEEYKVLKSEQGQRIGFRDNLLYFTLGLFGAISAFAITNTKGYYAFLVIPLICLVMGWTYVVNDEKISSLGLYIRNELDPRISNLMDGVADNKVLFGWEVAHRKDINRTSRKRLQLLIDEITFVLSGLIAIVIFWLLVPQFSAPVVVLSAIEVLLLLGLGIQILKYADLAKRRRKMPNQSV